MRLPFTRKPPAPAAAAERIEPPAPRIDPPMMRRSYKAATAHRLAGGFKAFGGTTTREETRREVKGLVSHARHAAHNFDHARAYEMLIRRHVIGPHGIRLQMDCRDTPARKDQLANDQIEAAWTKWGRKGSPTICGRWSWWSVECQVVTGIAREGGSFLRLHRGAKGGPFGLRVEALPFDLLDLDLTQALGGGAYIESGIEFDADDRPQAYYLWSAAADVSHRKARRRIRVPAADIIHVMVPEEVGQALGVPRSATALRLMNMGESYGKAALEAAHFGAAAMMFFTRDDKSGEIADYDNNDGPPIDTIEAGSILDLPPGVTPVPHAPKYPEAAIEPFMRHMHQSEASGLGLSYETLTSDLSRANFSSLRAGKGEERDEWRMLQRAVFEGLHDVVFREWLKMALLTQAVRLPLSKFDKWDAATWRPRGWQSVNPKEDATAAEKEIALGLRSPREIVAERGRDYSDVLRETAEDRQAAKDLGLDFTPPAASPPPAPDLEELPE